MNNLVIPNDIYGVTEKQGKPIVSSRYVADVFNKRHDNVIADIRKLECSEEFRLLNFKESYYKNEQNKKQPKADMTFDGFIFLAMGYTGKRAAQIKEQYIKAFNKMKDFILELQTAKEEFKELSEAIKLSHLEDGLHSYHFSNEYDLINRIALGVSTKQFKKRNGISLDEKSIRPFLTKEQLEHITKLEKFDSGLVITMPEYDDRKRLLTNYYNRLCRSSLSA